MRNKDELTSKVAGALASNDLSRARELALTQEHWKMISDAERRINTPVTGRTKADVRVEASQSRECRDAKMSYENESSSIKKDYALIDSAKRMMYAACGIDAPNEVTVRNTTIVNNPPRDVSRSMNCYTRGNGRISCN
ncbi:MAG: hypothetical protein PHV02_10515 [Rhodocyclaceae bacterium]|nr:hypothetical protein [Rhodocyclaceae bacterium]